MKTLNQRDIVESGGEELLKQLHDSKHDLYEMRVKAKTGQMENTSDIQKQKKQIARILTEINSRKLQDASKIEQKKS